MMNYLQKRIVEYGLVLPGNVLKIDSFLNHQIDPKVMKEIEAEFYVHFKDRPVTKVLTVEASGIAPALLVASHFDVPMLFAKKSEPSTLNKESQYATDVHSYTKNVTNRILISKQYLNEDDHVLIIDDFLANGEASLGMIDLVRQANATVSGVGICVEKSFQPGREKIEAEGVEVYSICRIASLNDGEVQFAEGH